MKTIISILFIINFYLLEQGNFTTEWTSPISYSIYFTQAETNNNIIDIYLFQPPFVKVYDGATKNLKYQYSNSDSSYLYYTSFDPGDYRLDINNDNVCEVLTLKYINGTPNTYILKILNGANGSVVFQDSGTGYQPPYVFDIDGDGYLELMITSGYNGQYSLKIISTTAHPIAVENNSKTVGDYQLGQNYPNPFNPTTTIEYSISKEASTEINIYNELGQIVKTLNEGSKKAGDYKVVVDCTGMASGVYFYQLVTDGIADVKKMVLVK
jgi:hypothetical protein